MRQTDSDGKEHSVDTLHAEGTWDRLGSIALLLHQAATQVWTHADLAPADSPLHDLGLGVYLAHSQARSLLPDDYQLPDVDEDAEFEQRTPLQLLSEAEELTRPLPLHRPDLMHGTQLVVELCDLIREARGLGY